MGGSGSGDDGTPYNYIDHYYSSDRCGCLDGYYRNEEGDCVAEAGCKPADIRKNSILKSIFLECAANEVWDVCGFELTNLCGEPDPTRVTQLLKIFNF